MCKLFLLHQPDAFAFGRPPHRSPVTGVRVCGRLLARMRQPKQVDEPRLRVHRSQAMTGTSDSGVRSGGFAPSKSDCSIGADRHMVIAMSGTGGQSSADELSELRTTVARLQLEVRELRARLAAVSSVDDPDSPTFDTQVDLAGLMAVVSGHLYSTPIVAVRELVQNAHDSIVRRRRVEPSYLEGAVTVTVDDAARLVISDNGIGMTGHDIHDFLATVGRGETGNLRRGGDDADLIGQFGLGFLSAFVLGSAVEVRTISSTDLNTGHVYNSTDGLTYTVEAMPAAEVRSGPGSTVVITLNEKGRGLADEARLANVLGHYCCLLRVPVIVNGSPINLRAPWRSEHPDAAAADAANAEFAARFEHGLEPIATVNLTADASDLEGMLWIQDHASYASSDNRNLSVFVRGMLLDSDSRDLLPRWAGFIGGVVESRLLAPTASREDVQRTEHFDAARASIAAQLISGLAALADRDPATWQRVVRRHNDALLGAAVVDEAVFDLVADNITVATSVGDLTPAALARQSGGRIHVALERSGGFAEVLYHSLGLPIAWGERFGVHAFLRRWAQRNGYELVEIGTEEGDSTLFRPAEIGADDVAWLQRGLVGVNEQLVAARYEPASLPVVVVVDRAAEVRRRVDADEASRRIPTAALALARAHTADLADRPISRLYINLSNPAVTALLSARRQGAARADDALALLRSVKVVLAASSGPLQPADHLPAALTEICSAIAAMAEGA
jgi:molecular chaperone HtpG